MHDPPLEQHPFLKILAATEAAAAAGEAKPGACFTPKLSPHWQSALQLQETPPEEQPFDLIPLKFSVAEQQPLVRILVASETEEDPPPEQQPFLQLFFVAEAILFASETPEDPPPEQQPFLQLFFVAEAILVASETPEDPPPEKQPLVRILVASETEEDPPPEQQPFLQLFFVAEAIANWNLESEEHERNVTTTKKTDTGPSANTLK